MSKVTVNGNKTYEIDGHQVDGVEVLADIVKTGERFFHVLHEGNSHTVELVKMDRPAKSVTLKVGNSIYEVQVKDRFDILLEKMGLQGSAQRRISEMKAPMPGLVIDVRVEAGQKILKGDALIVLEAMKMENVLKAAGDGVVKSVEAKKGVNVEKGQVLIVFE